MKWGWWGSNPRPRDYESPALTTELQPLAGVSCHRLRRALALPWSLPQFVSVTGTIRECLPGYFELRAYNVAAGKQVTRTSSYPS
jgi:hypothetical protein